MKRFRVLVLGSQKWPRPQVVHRTLDDLRARLPFDAVLVVVHGDCDDGADKDGREWARHHRARPVPGLADVEEEKHPADWPHCTPQCRPDHRKRRRDGTEYCPSAGHRRNQAMVDTRPSFWLAFSLDDSPGTEGTIKALRRARVDGKACYAYSKEA